eukprot:4693559-Pyramimonas_sp.AAC.1
MPGRPAGIEMIAIPGDDVAKSIAEFRADHNLRRRLKETANVRGWSVVSSTSFTKRKKHIIASEASMSPL